MVESHKFGGSIPPKRTKIRVGELMVYNHPNGSLLKILKHWGPWGKISWQEHGPTDWDWPPHD